MTVEPSTARELITIAQAAERWQVHPRTVRRRIAEGRLTAYRVGPASIRIDADELDAMLRPIPTAVASATKSRVMNLTEFLQAQMLEDAQSQWRDTRTTSCTISWATRRRPCDCPDDDPCKFMRALASVYADHPDYLPEWKP